MLILFPQLSCSDHRRQVERSLNHRVLPPHVAARGPQVLLPRPVAQDGLDLHTTRSPRYYYYSYLSFWSLKVTV